LIIYGNGEQTRDFIHVSDICQAIYLCLTKIKKARGEVFQIASGVETSINALIALFEETFNKKIDLVYHDKRTGEIERNYSDISKACTLLGFKPEIDLYNGLRYIITSS
jgi:UDP-glucose 4-epimerase